MYAKEGNNLIPMLITNYYKLTYIQGKMIRDVNLYFLPAILLCFLSKLSYDAMDFPCPWWICYLCVKSRLRVRDESFLKSS